MVIGIGYIEEELNCIDKSLFAKLFLVLQNYMNILTGETKTLNNKMHKKMEQLEFVNASRFADIIFERYRCTQVGMTVDEYLIFGVSADKEDKHMKCVPHPR